MLMREPLKQFTIPTKEKYFSSKILETIEKWFARQGDKHMLDSSLKNTTKVYIQNKRAEVPDKSASTWGILNSEPRKRSVAVIA
jgi:hypothetical protein